MVQIMACHQQALMVQQQQSSKAELDVISPIDIADVYDTRWLQWCNMNLGTEMDTLVHSIQTASFLVRFPSNICCMTM